MKDYYEKAKNAVEDAAEDSNEFVQDKGPVALSYIKEYWWIGAVVLIVLVGGWYIWGGSF